MQAVAANDWKSLKSGRQRDDRPGRAKGKIGVRREDHIGVQVQTAIPLDPVHSKQTVKRAALQAGVLRRGSVSKAQYVMGSTQS